MALAFSSIKQEKRAGGGGRVVRILPTSVSKSVAVLCPCSEFLSELPVSRFPLALLRCLSNITKAVYLRSLRVMLTPSEFYSLSEPCDPLRGTFILQGIG